MFGVFKAFNKRWNLQACLIVLNILSTPFGMGAITSPNLGARRAKVKYILIGIVVLTTMITSYVQTYRTNMENKTKARKLLNMLRAFKTISVSLIILNSSSMNLSFRKATKKLEETDAMLAKLGLAPDYKIPIITLIILFLCVLASSYMAIQSTFYASTSMVYLQRFFECYHFTISVLIVLYLTLFCFICLVRLTSMEKMLTHIKSNTVMDVYKCSPLEVLLTVSKMYQSIYHSVGYVNEMMSAPLLLLTINDVLEMLVIGKIFYEGESIFHDYVNAVSIVNHLLWIIITPLVVKHKCKQLSIILPECDICYTDIEMSTAKNTFLLQLFHQGLQFSIYDSITVSVDSIIEQITFGITIVIFLFKLADNF